MKNLITIAVAVLIAAIAFQGRAIIIVPLQTVSCEGASNGNTSFKVNAQGVQWCSPALISAPVPEPSALTLLLASAFALCLLKDRLKL